MSPFLKRQLIFFMSTLLLMATNVFAQKVKIEGDLESFYEDYAGNTHKLKQYIKDKKGNRYEIKSEKALPITSKSDISLSGKILKRGKNGAHDTLQLDETQESSLFLNAGLAGDNPYPIKGSENAYSMGEQKTLLVLVNFYDNATQSISLEQGQAWFNELDTFVREASHGKAWLTGKVAGWYTIDLTSTVCDSFGVRTHTDTKLLQDGIDPKLYDRIIYAFPKMNCGYSGSGQVGGVPTTAFVNNQFGKTGTLFHEYGHNLGLGHAMAYQCDDATLGGTNCHKIVYGDTLDVMGDSRVEYGTFNPYNRMFLGWLDKEQVIEVTQNSTVNIIPYTDNKNLGPKVIKIPKPGHPGHWFTIDFHQAIGLDNKLIYETDLVTANILNGVIIRETEDGASYLLNATPASSWSRYYDMRDPALEVGNSFQDPYSGVRITTLMASTGGATVQVEFTGEQSCREGGISLGNLDTINAYPDRTSNVSLSIDSQNSTACGDEIVTATTSVSSAGLSVDFGDQPISLVAAKSTKVPFTVTAATGMAYGRYTITPTFTTSSGATYSKSYSVWVRQYVNNAPTAATDSVDLVSKSESIIIDVLANDKDSNGDSLKVISVSKPSSGSVIINSDNTLTYTPSKRFKASDTFYYTVSDGKLSSNAYVYISYTSSGDTTDGSSTGGGGKGGGKGRNK